MKRIAIFASGNGTNAKNIIQYFRHHPDVKVECIVCNNSKAKVIEVAHETGVPYYLIEKNDLSNDRVLNLLSELHIDLIVLAGFLLLIPEKILNAFPDKIINIHPALLPKFGGAGMYGMRVHEEVKRAGEKETGITIHLLNEKYDEGKIIAQYTVAVDETDTPETIAAKVQELGYEWYPKIIEELLMKN